MITKVAIDKEKHTDNLVFTKSARKAFAHVLQNLKSQFGELNVLLPSYIGITNREGSGVFDPIEESDAGFDFYVLNEKLEIDIDSLILLVKNKKFHVLLVIHYFGLCKNNMNIIMEFCKKHDLILIEDCAHAFHLGMPEQKLGIFGDFAFYSVHKYLPVKDGGILKINTDKFQLSKLNDTDQMSIEVLQQIVKTDYVAIAKKRRNNFNFYHEQLKGINHFKIMFNLDVHEIPQTFPILIGNGLREKLYFFLIEKELPVIALYYRMIEEIEQEKFPISYQISNNILNLPVHQDIEFIDIKNLCDAIKQFYTQL